MPERNYILGFQNAAGEFDVFAKFRGKEPPTDERLKAIIREVLCNGNITQDVNGRLHFSEKGQQHG